VKTTLDLEADVLNRARAAAEKQHISLDAFVNGVLQLGLAEAEKPLEQRPYRTIAHAMGRRSGYNVDNIQELLSQAEGENFR
jgi:hypothetical protein